MGFWDLVKTGLALYGMNELMKGKDNKKSGYDPGAWRRDLDRENDSYRHYFHDDDDLL